MKVSVITVCFNANASIEACLESVANQTYSDIEHIVIDGGSTDGTIATVRRYPHVATVVSESDSGIFNAMNKGISRATGEYLIFLNADDLFPKPDALEAAMAAIRNMPDADVIYGGLNVRGKDGSSQIFHPPPPEGAAEFMVCGCLPHQATLARRWVFGRTSGFNEAYRIHADYDWYLKVLADPDIKVRRIDCVVGSYFFGGASANLALGQPEVYPLQNTSKLYASPKWDRLRIALYQARVLELRLETDQLRNETQRLWRDIEKHSGGPKNKGALSRMLSGLFASFAGGGRARRGQ